MLKKSMVWLAAVVLFLAGCTPSLNNEDEVVQNEDESDPQQNSIVPGNQLSDEQYRTILPYRPSASRGVIVNQLGNRMDIDEMETGLRRLSKEYYDPEDYFFEEGQYLTEDMLYNWLETYPTQEQLAEAEADAKTKEEAEAVKKELKLALNPPLGDEGEATEEDYRDNPKYLSHILEHNFLTKNEDDTVELAGVSIGIAMKSVYSFQVQNGPSYTEEISQSKMMEKGKEIAQTVLERVRNIEELNDMPIMIALYREEEQGSPVPGNYVATTGVQSGDATIDEWEDVNEENVLFPSDEGEEKYYDEQQLIQNFGERIQEYFPNYVGVIGKGFYINEELQKLTLEIPLEFYGKGEVVGFTQYTYGLVEEMFQNYYDLEVKIKSNTKLESMILRDSGEDQPNVHIFDE